MNPSSGINPSFNSPQQLPAAQAGQPLPFAQAGQAQPARPFNQFVRYVAPTPLPTKWDFYWDEFRTNYRKSKREGSQRYQQEIKSDKKAGLKLAVLSMAAALGFTAFRRLKRCFSLVFMMGLLSYPIMEANRTFPKLAEAYEQVKTGNPSQGKETFRKAMDDSIYAIFEALFQPISKGMLIALVLSAPGTLLRRDGGAMQGIIREAFKILKVHPHMEAKPGMNVVKKFVAVDIPRFIMGTVKLLDKVAKPLTEWGNRNSNRIRQKSFFGVKLIDKIESS